MFSAVAVLGRGLSKLSRASSKASTGAEFNAVACDRLCNNASSSLHRASASSRFFLVRGVRDMGAENVHDFPALTQNAHFLLSLDGTHFVLRFWHWRHARSDGVPLLFRMALISERSVAYMIEAHPECGALLEETSDRVIWSEQSLPMPRPPMPWRFTSNSISSTV